MFKLLNYLSLTYDVLFDLYELIVDDLIDKECYAAARFVIGKCLAEGSHGK